MSLLVDGIVQMSPLDMYIIRTTEVRYNISIAKVLWEEDLKLTDEEFKEKYWLPEEEFLHMLKTIEEETDDKLQRWK
jgi:hypothetical protein